MQDDAPRFGDFTGLDIEALSEQWMTDFESVLGPQVRLLAQALPAQPMTGRPGYPTVEAARWDTKAEDLRSPTSQATDDPPRDPNPRTADMPTRNGSTSAWRRTRARILATTDVCWICGNPGADAVDHKVPLARGGTDDPSNLAPAHHDVAPYCNRVKSDREYAPIVRRSGTLNR